MSNWYDNCKFNLDYLNGVIQDWDTSVEDFIRDLSFYDDRLRLENWHFDKLGRYNYQNSAKWLGNNHFMICWNPNERSELVPHPGDGNRGLFISISGKGISHLQQHSNTLPSLIKVFYNSGFRCSRFDVNCDIFNKDNPIVPCLIDSVDNALIRKEGSAGLVTNLRRNNTNFKVFPVVDLETNEKFYNCYIGSHASNFGMFRCYNKKIQIKEMECPEVATVLLDREDNPDYWYRLEYEVHKENADCVFKAFAENKITLQGAFLACANRFFTPVVQCSAFNKNYSESCVTSQCWVMFIEYLSLFISYNSGNIEIFNHTPYVPKDISRVQRNLERLSSYLVLYEKIKLLHPDWYNSEILQKGESKFKDNPRYFEIRNQLGGVV